MYSDIVINIYVLIFAYSTRTHMYIFVLCLKPTKPKVQSIKRKSNCKVW